MFIYSMKQLSVCVNVCGTHYYWVIMTGKVLAVINNEFNGRTNIRSQCVMDHRDVRGLVCSKWVCGWLDSLCEASRVNDVIKGRVSTVLGLILLIWARDYGIEYGRSLREMSDYGN